jgi:hypothetical protein
LPDPAETDVVHFLEQSSSPSPQPSITQALETGILALFYFDFYLFCPFFFYFSDLIVVIYFPANLTVISIAATCCFDVPNLSSLSLGPIAVAESARQRFSKDHRPL